MKDKKTFASNFKVIEQESNKLKARRIFQEVGENTLVINPPFPTMTEAEIDGSFDLPYTRLPHPKYNKRGPIPAFEMIKFSIIFIEDVLVDVVFVPFLHIKENLLQVEVKNLF